MPKIKLHYATRVVLPYGVFAALWIYLSDLALAALVTDAEWLTRLQTYKGLAFVCVTALLLYGLLRRDFAKCEQTEQTLNEKQSLLAESQRIARIGSWSWEATTQALSWSEEMYSLYGVIPGKFALTMDTFLNLIHPDDRGTMLAWIDSCIAGDCTEELEFRVVPPMGEMRILSGRGVLHRDAENQPLRMTGTAQDITTRKRAEQALQASEQRLRLALDAAHMGIFDWDVPHNRITWSRRHEELWGFKPGEFGGTYQAFSERLHPDDLPGINAEVARCIAARAPFVREFRVVWPDGSIHWISARGEFAFDADGQALRMCGVAVEITVRKQAENQLQERERLLSTLIGNLPGAVFRVRNDLNYSAEYVSDQIAALTGYPADDFRENRRNFGELMHPEDRNRVWNETQKALGEHRPYEVTYRFIDAHGQEKWNWERGGGIFDANGALQAVEGFVQDITARKQAEAALLERDEILRLFVEHSPAAIGMFDNEMHYVAVSRRWLTDYGLGDQDLIGRSHYDIFPEIPQRWKDIHQRCLAGATARGDDDPFVRADGHTEWVKWEICPWHQASGVIGGIIIFSELVTARKQAELKIAEDAARLERLSRQLLAAQETERRHIARELHDEIGQLLTVVKLDLQTVLRQTGIKALSPALRESMDAIDRVIARVRDLSLDLRPSLLDDLGLAAALRWLAQRQALRLGVTIDLDLPPTTPRLTGEIETACFRIVQEALTNAARHANAKTIHIALTPRADDIELMIGDDGQGFDLAVAREAGREGSGFGLLSMQERAELAGGQLTIISVPGQGTTVTARFPMPETGRNARGASTP